jgi:hypothetical protein
MTQTIQELYEQIENIFVSDIVIEPYPNKKTYDYVLFITYKHIYLLFEVIQDTRINLSKYAAKLQAIENKIYTRIDDMHYTVYYVQKANHNVLFDTYFTALTTQFADKNIIKLRLKNIKTKYHLMCDQIKIATKHSIYQIMKGDYMNIVANKHNILIRDDKYYHEADKKDIHNIFDTIQGENKNDRIEMSDNKPNIEINTTMEQQPIITATNYKVYPLIQLPNNLHNYIFITENNYKNCYNIPNRLIPLYIKINNIIYYYIDVLGCGISGIVLKYTNGPQTYSLKIVKGANDDDVIMGLLIATIPNCKNYIINYCILKNNNPLIHEYYILMDYYDKTLSNIDEFKLTIKNKIQLIIQIIEACICFKQNNLYYTDLKAINILCKQQNKHIICVFADIGSFANQTGASTYPQPGKHTNGNISSANYETNICWSVFVLFLYFIIGTSVSDYAYNSDITLSQHLQVLTQIQNSRIRTFFIAEMQYGKTFTFDEILKSFQNITRTLI